MTVNDERELWIPLAHTPTIIFRHEPQDRSGAECGVCPHPLGGLLGICPNCGHSPVLDSPTRFERWAR